jgi:hypothetical protein
MTESMFKPGYDGDRPSTTMTGPEKQSYRQGAPAMVKRIHEAMLTLATMDGAVDLGVVIGGTPSHIVEFGDRVGEDAGDSPRAKFKPTPAQVSDMDKALRLLEGLRKSHFRVVLLRALHLFAEEEGERGDWPWAKIGGMFGFSGAWAESAYDAAMVQAARRAGILPMTQKDYAVVVAASFVNHGWLANIGTAADPRQAVSIIRHKSAVKVDDAFAVWVAGPPLAKRVMDAARQHMRNLHDHGSWYRTHPDVLVDLLALSAREVGAEWQIEDIATRGPAAAA